MSSRADPWANSRRPGTVGAGPDSPAVPSLWSLRFALVMLLAIGVRVLLFNGPFGSDDVVYYARSAEIADGSWTSAHYNGALRYGFNIPAGLLMFVFGKSLFAANLWPLICSIAEVAVVYWFALRFWDARAAVFAGLLLAFVPLHIGVATRIHSDPVVAFVLTLGFVLFYMGHLTRRASIYFWSGIAVGAVFWVKELVAVTYLAFLAFPLVWRKFEKQWLVWAAAALSMLLLHFVFFYWLADDPLHLFKVVLSAIKTNFIDGGTDEDAPMYYFRFLLFDIRHTGLVVGILLLAVALRIAGVGQRFESSDATRFVMIWALSLLVVLSWVPVSLSPLRFVMKQSNYLTLFIAPLCLLAGLAASRLPPRLGHVLLGAALVVGTVFALLAQADYRVFASNAKAAVEFAEQHPVARFAGSSLASNLSAYSSVRATGTIRSAPIEGFWEVAPGSRKLALMNDGSKPIYAVLDRQTMNWSSRGVVVDEPRPCWSKVEELTPKGLGIGNTVVGWGIGVIGHLPGAIGEGINARLGRLTAPEPATVYKVEGADLWCGMPPEAPPAAP